MNAPPRLHPQPEPVAPDWRHAFGGVWRLTFRRLLLPGHWLALGVGLAVLALLLVGGVQGGDAGRFLDWANHVYVGFLVPVLAFMSAAGAMRDELKSSTVDYVFTRPMSRPAFVGFKFIAHTLCTHLDFLLPFAVVAFAGVTRGVPDPAAFMVKLGFAQALMITAFSALGILFGTLTSRYIVAGLAYAAIIEVGVGQIPTQISRLSLTQQMRELLAILLGRAEAQAHSPGIAGTLGAVALLCLGALGLAAVLFRRREFGASADT